jgi:histidinol-phosphatase
MNPDWRSRYEVALDVARKAGQLALRYFDAVIDVEWKSDQSPVTVADREAEALLRSTLLAKFPGDGYLGEESGYVDGTTGFRWIIDPVDGTRNFVRGVPIWATLVGLEYKDKQIAGIAVVPALGQTFRALRGDGAFRDDKPIRVSQRSSLGDSMLFYSSLSWFIKAGHQDTFLYLVQNTYQQRGFGDFYGHLLVAQGSGEIMVEHGVHAWDVAALKAIVEEAGGRYSTWDGTTSIHQPDVLLTNGLVHDQVLSILQRKHKT